MANLVVRSAVKESVGDMRVSGDLAEALDGVVAATLTRAAERCKANGRQTLKPYDL